MAGEIAFDFQNGASCYVNIRNRTSGFIWNGSTFENYTQASGNIASYAVPVTEQGASAHFVGNMPATIPAGVYDITAKQQIQAPYLESDRVVAAGEVQWNGSVAVPLSNLATSGQIGEIGPIRMARGVMIRNFPLYLKSSADHVTPMTSGVVSGQIARDGGAFGALQSGAFTEIGLGYYTLQALTSGDLLANTVMLRFSANGISGGQSDPLAMSIVLQKTSGQ
jgi:hypothetical protein